MHNLFIIERILFDVQLIPTFCIARIHVFTTDTGL